MTIPYAAAVERMTPARWTALLAEWPTRSGVTIVGLPTAPSLVPVFTASTAQISVGVNLKGFDCQVFVDYGLSPRLGSTSSPVAVSATSTGALVTVPLPTLTGNRAYWVRARAVTIRGESVSRRQLIRVGTGSTWHVATTGNDTTGTGASGAPWLTFQKAAASAGPGDVVLVHAGSYAAQTLTAQKTGLVWFMPAGDGPVQVSSLLFNQARFLGFEQVNLDGHAFATDPSDNSNHLWEAFGADATHEASDLVLSYCLADLNGKTNGMCLRASTDSTRCYFDNVETRGGGVGFYAYHSGLDSTRWADFYDANACVLGADTAALSHTQDIRHLLGAADFNTYDCVFRNPRSLSGFVDPSEEHHDGLSQDQSTIRCYDENPLVYDRVNTLTTGPSNAYLGNPDVGGAVVTDRVIVNGVFESWKGAGANVNGWANGKLLACSFGRCPGPGDGSAYGSTGNLCDVILGTIGGTSITASKVVGCVAQLGFFSGDVGTTIDRNHWADQRGTTNQRGTNSTTGAVSYVANQDLHLSDLAQPAASGGASSFTDAAILKWGADGVGHDDAAGVRAKGAYARSDSRTPRLGIVRVPIASGRVVVATRADLAAVVAAGLPATVADGVTLVGDPIELPDGADVRGASYLGSTLNFSLLASAGSVAIAGLRFGPGASILLSGLSSGYVAWNLLGGGGTTDYGIRVQASSFVRLWGNVTRRQRVYGASIEAQGFGGCEIRHHRWDSIGRTPPVLDGVTECGINFETIGVVDACEGFGSPTAEIRVAHTQSQAIVGGVPIGSALTIVRNCRLEGAVGVLYDGGVLALVERVQARVTGTGVWLRGAPGDFVGVTVQDVGVLGGVFGVNVENAFNPTTLVQRVTAYGQTSASIRQKAGNPTIDTASSDLQPAAGGVPYLFVP